MPAAAKKRAKRKGLRPAECFDLAQKITEVGAALAYAEHFVRRLTPPGDARRTPPASAADVSAGLKTAVLAAGRLAQGLPVGGHARAAAELLGRDVEELNKEVRSAWVVGAGVPTVEDAGNLGRRVGDMRKRVLDMWASARLMCGVSGGDRRRKGR